MFLQLRRNVYTCRHKIVSYRGVPYCWHFQLIKRGSGSVSTIGRHSLDLNFLLRVFQQGVPPVAPFSTIYKCVLKCLHNREIVSTLASGQQCVWRMNQIIDTFNTPQPILTRHLCTMSTPSHHFDGCQPTAKMALFIYSWLDFLLHRRILSGMPGNSMCRNNAVMMTKSLIYIIIVYIIII